MTKEEILKAYRQLAEKYGSAPGREKFQEETHIMEHEWSGKYWLKWSDLVTDAGYEPNVFGKERHNDTWLLEQLCQLIRELGHFPTQAELKFKKYNDDNFPGPKSFERFGNKNQNIIKVNEFCEKNEGYADVLNIVRPLVAATKDRSKKSTDKESEEYGFVYLFWSERMKLYKLGFSNHVGRRNYDLSTKLPEELKEIHKIKTDDPEGVEKYWHGRFDDKRMKDRRGDTEWFELSKSDVSKFKRWKRIF